MSDLADRPKNPVSLTSERDFANRTVTFKVVLPEVVFDYTPHGTNMPPLVNLAMLLLAAEALWPIPPGE